MRLADRLANDSKCPACKGTGRRGRGKCRACDGMGQADLMHPRIRFNWGFHDGAMEAQEGRERNIPESGAHAQWWYAAGYAAGKAACANGSYTNNSDPAWLELIGPDLDARYNWR